uniref:Uncharacterized protein n=1 Tax=Siphoviridae sp. ct6Ob18 TaxID=2827783 RepID=A0A8S5TH38_9CAUD|nr:MAG TPA: hypothetical protein [Siphoviridae sp. ct6Ob18]
MFDKLFYWLQIYIIYLIYEMLVFVFFNYFID